MILLDDILKYLIENDKINLIEIKQEIELKENKRFLEYFNTKMDNQNQISYANDSEPYIHSLALKT